MKLADRIEFLTDVSPDKPLEMAQTSCLKMISNQFVVDLSDFPPFFLLMQLTRVGNFLKVWEVKQSWIEMKWPQATAVCSHVVFGNQECMSVGVK